MSIGVSTQEVNDKVITSIDHGIVESQQENGLMKNIEQHEQNNAQTQSIEAMNIELQLHDETENSDDEETQRENGLQDNVQIQQSVDDDEPMNIELQLHDGMENSDDE